MTWFARFLMAVTLSGLTLFGPGSGTAAPAFLTPAPATQNDDKGTPKVVQVGPQVFLEISPVIRKVVITSKVVRREGLLELLLCRDATKEHESILSTKANAKDIHQALLTAGLKSGSPVRFTPEFQPASGQSLEIQVRYKDAKGVDRLVPAREWVRKTGTKELLSAEWVFGGSKLVPNLQDPKGPPYFLANDGDLISISNFESSLIDLSIKVSDSNNELAFEPVTDRIPPLGSAVAVIISGKPAK